MLVSVVITTRNRPRSLRRCVDSVLASDWKEFEIIVVDDHSDYDVESYLRDIANLRVLKNARRMLLSFSRNVGAKISHGEMVFFLDDDNVIAPDAIRKMVSVLKADDRTAVCSPLIYFYRESSRIWSSTINKGRFPGSYVLGRTEPSGIVQTFSFHDAFIVKKAPFEASGMFDSRYFPIHFGELDLAYRLNASGYLAKMNPGAKVWHDVAKAHMNVDSVRSFYTIRNRILLLKRYEPEHFGAYLVQLLLPLTAYYLLHHIRNSKDSKLRTAINLLLGEMDGIATSIPRFVPTKLHRAFAKQVYSNPPLVSVIVPTRNSEMTIGTCLESLINQSYPNLEIIVVDNSSTDRTVRIAKSYPNVKTVSGGPERSAQLNIAAKFSKGQYLYRVDSDFVVEPRVIEEAVGKCEFEGFRVVTIHNTSDPRLGFWAQVRKLERDCYVDDDTHIAARFFEKKVFDLVGGYDESMIAAEDYDLHNRLVEHEFVVGRIESKELHIGEPTSLKEVVIKHFFYGRSVSAFIRGTPSGTWLRELGPVRLAYLRHWKTFFMNPLVTAGFVLYQYVRYASALTGYVSSWLR